MNLEFGSGLLFDWKISSICHISHFIYLEIFPYTTPYFFIAFIIFISSLVRILIGFLTYLTYSIDTPNIPDVSLSDHPSSNFNYLIFSIYFSVNSSIFTSSSCFGYLLSLISSSTYLTYSIDTPNIPDVSLSDHPSSNFNYLIFSIYFSVSSPIFS